MVYSDYKNVQSAVSPELFNRILAECEKRGCSVSGIVREVLAAHFG